MNAICSENATLVRKTGPCPTVAVPTTTFDFYPTKSRFNESHEKPTSKETPEKPSESPDTDGPVGRLSFMLPLCTPLSTKMLKHTIKGNDRLNCSNQVAVCVIKNTANILTQIIKICINKFKNKMLTAC